ncbi:MAG: Rrf2 family transcriptional regulator [Desulfovibrionaceae bacterium]
MKLTTRSRYGTRMLLDIARNGAEGPVRISDIAQRQKVSVKYLEKLIRELRLAGFIRSRRGPKGGHMLNVPAADIHIGDVVRVLEGDDALVDCASDKIDCDRAADCATRAVWRAASRAVYQALNAYSVADLLAAGEPGCSPVGSTS